MPTVASTLQAFGPQTLVVRATTAVLAVVPGAPSIEPWTSVDDAAAAMVPGASDAWLARARELGDDAVSSAILDLGAAIDAADRTLLARFARGAPLEPQAEDAVLKALALGWFASRVGGAEPFRSAPAGRALIAYWAAADVGLPLGGGDLGVLLQAHKSSQASRLAGMVGEEAFGGAVGGLDALLPTLQKVVDATAKRTDAVLAALAPFVPGLVAEGTGADEEVAARADRMPVYKWLAARLAAEHAVRRASSEAGPTPS